MHSSTYVVFCIIKLFQKNPTILLEGIKSANDEIIKKKIASSNPNWLEFWTFQGIWSHKIEKESGIVKLDMASEKIPRMEELERDNKRCKRRFPK